MKRAAIYTNDVHIERWTGEQVVRFQFRSGDESYNFIVPEYVAQKLSSALDFKLDEVSDR
jgi:hypothetical protein